MNSSCQRLNRHCQTNETIRAESFDLQLCAQVNSWKTVVCLVSCERLVRYAYDVPCSNLETQQMKAETKDATEMTHVGI